VVPRADRADWIAFVSEDLGEDEAGPIATARFSVMLERESSGGHDVEIADESMPALSAFLARS
jgi:hypothetical protein